MDWKLIVKGDQSRGNLFYLDMNDATYLVVEFDDVWLWNKRLCHVNFKNLVSISNMRRVIGFPKLKKPDNIICKQCQLGKMKNLVLKVRLTPLKKFLRLFILNFMDQLM